MKEIEVYIKNLEDNKEIDPQCPGCTQYFYPKLQEGKKIYHIFAPRHKPSERCRSGKHPHCTCDTCF